MVNKFCDMLDTFSRLEEKEGALGQTVGVLYLVVMGLIGLMMMGLGLWIVIYSFTEIINKIFF